MFSPLGGCPLDWAPRPAGTSGDLRSWANETDIVARSCGHGHPISSARGHKRRSSSETIPADPHSVGRRRRRPGRVRATDSNPLGTLTRHTPSPQRSPDTAPFLTRPGSRSSRQRSLSRPHTLRWRRTRSHRVSSAGRSCMRAPRSRRRARCLRRTSSAARTRSTCARSSCSPTRTRSWATGGRSCRTGVQSWGLTLTLTLTLTVTLTLTLQV